MPENLLYSYNINFSKDSSSSNDEFLGTASFSFYSGSPDTDIHVGDELNNWLSELIVPNRFIRKDMIEGRRLHGEYNDCIFIPSEFPSLVVTNVTISDSVIGTFGGLPFRQWLINVEGLSLLNITLRLKELIMRMLLFRGLSRLLTLEMSRSSSLM